MFSMGARCFSNIVLAKALLTGRQFSAQIHHPPKALTFFKWRAAHVIGQTTHQSLWPDYQCRRHLRHRRGGHHHRSHCCEATEIARHCVSISLLQVGFDRTLGFATPNPRRSFPENAVAALLWSGLARLREDRGLGVGLLTLVNRGFVLPVPIWNR